MRRSGLWVGIVLVALVILAALVSLVWAPYDPLQVQPTQILQSAGWRHLLGTDGFGIDILSRLVVGARTTVFVGVVAVSLAALGGVPLGVLAGMRGGWVSEIVLRVSDILYAFPALLLAILLAAAVGASTLTAMVAIGIASIPAFARVARANAGIEAMPMATMAVSVEAPTAAASRIASSSAGNAYRMSLTRSTISDTQPPRMPARTPSGTPPSAARLTATTPTNTVVLAPTTSRDRMSMPKPSVPRR